MKLTNFDLNLLIALHYLIEERNVTKAAAKMYISQPAMSATLNRIRKMLDDEILVRVGHTMQVTALAESIRPQLTSILTEIDVLLSTKPDFDHTSAERRFRIGASDYITLVFLRHVIAEINEIAPGVTLEIVPVGREYVESLTRGDLDFVILPKEIAEDPEKFAQSHLFIDEFVCIASQSNNLVNEVLDSDDFLKLSYVAYQVNGTAGYVDRTLNELGFIPTPEMITESFLIAPFIVETTQMVTILHERLAKAMQHIVKIKKIKIPFNIPPIHQTLFWNPRFNDAPDFLWLRNLLEESAKKL